MELELDDVERAALDDFATALGKLGMRRVPLVLPAQEFFPDGYAPTPSAIGGLLHRLLHYAGLTLDFDLVDGRPALEEPTAEQVAVTRPAIDLVSLDGDRAVFRVGALGPGDLTVAALCHEVARASLGLEASARVVAAATIAHGFGLLTLPAASSYRRSSVFTGHHVRTRQALVLTGGMSSGELSLLLAAWLVLRDGDEAELVRRHLDREPADDVTRWMEALGKSRRDLRERLRLPFSDERVRVTSPPAVPPLPASIARRLDEADERARRPHQGRTAARLWQPKTVEYSMIGLLLGTLALLAALVLPSLLSWLWVPPLVGLLLGGRVGRRARREYCAACKMLLRPDEQRCPKCGAQLVGSRPLVTRVADMPDDQGDGDADDELTREALAAGDGTGDGSDEDV